MELIVDNGKVIEPKMAQRTKAKIKREETLQIRMSLNDIHRIMAEKIWNDSPWIRNTGCYFSTLRIESPFTFVLELRKND